jgi:hypothetical protein
MADRSSLQVVLGGLSVADHVPQGVDLDAGATLAGQRAGN